VAPADQPRPSTSSEEPAPFPDVAAALEGIDDALWAATHGDGGARLDHAPEATLVLASLLLLREIRERLAGWETELIETARESGASWSDLAHPLGVASRQAAERRYLRLRPGAAGSTGEQRVQATRDRRAAERSVSAWARGNAADLRRLAAEVSMLTDLPRDCRTSLGHLDEALAGDDPADLIAPLAETRPHLRADHPELAARVHALTSHTQWLRQDSDQRRSAT
jgi:hypothetical protein